MEKKRDSLQEIYILLHIATIIKEDNDESEDLNVLC